MTWTRPPAIVSIAALLIMVVSGCRGNSVVENVNQTISDFIVENSIHPQQWTDAQTQGKLQPFPSDVTYKLQRLLDRSVGPEKLPGVVLYIGTPNGNWMGVSGKANLETGTALKPTDRFRIAGLTQLFVSVVCLRLAENEQLDLDKAIAEYLPPEVSHRIAGSDRITVRQLLNHTSGIPDSDTDAFKQAVAANPAHRWTAKEILDYVYPQKAAAPRGSFFYSNANYLLLQLIIEKVTGRPLAKVIRSQILEPLELKNTFLELEEPIPGGFVQGYRDWLTQDTAKNVTKPLVNAGLGLGNTGLVSNAPDLAKFFRSLFTDNDLLQSGSLDEMLTQVGDRERWGYGLGITYIPTVWGEAWGQTGKTIGFSAAIAYFPVHDLTVVAWTNDDNGQLGDPWEIAKRSLDVILEGPRY